jgi:hypothetical protein
VTPVKTPDRVIILGEVMVKDAIFWIAFMSNW